MGWGYLFNVCRSTDNRNSSLHEPLHLLWENRDSKFLKPKGAHNLIICCHQYYDGIIENKIEYASLSLIICNTKRSLLLLSETKGKTLPSTIWLFEYEFRHSVHLLSETLLMSLFALSALRFNSTKLSELYSQEHMQNKQGKCIGCAKNVMAVKRMRKYCISK